MAVIDDLRAAITGWRRTRDIRFGRVAEWALQRALPMPRSALTTTRWDAVFHAHDPLDVPRLIQFVSEHSFDPVNDERIRLLGRRSDPNIVAGAIGLLESFPDEFPNPENISATALLPLLGLVHASKDPRAVDVLQRARERLETTWQYTIGHGMVGPVDDLTSSVTPFAARVDLGDVATALEAGYPQQLAQTRDADRLRARLRTTDQGLLAAIHAAPDDDHPRMVFADALIERGRCRQC